MRSHHPFRLLALISLLGIVAAACSSGGSGDDSTDVNGSPVASASSGPCTPAESPVITLAAYSNVYDAYGKLISDLPDRVEGSPRRSAGHLPDVVRREHDAGAERRERLRGRHRRPVARARRPAHPGRRAHHPRLDRPTPTAGIVATSAVVFDVRQGNPKNINDWSDLAQPGLQILTPDPASSGGARWNIVAAYGAALRGEVEGYAANDPAAAEQLLTDIFKNVTVMDKSANDSIKNFQAGNGDVAITYEYAISGREQGRSPRRDGDPAVDRGDPDAGRGRRRVRRRALRRRTSRTPSSSTCTREDAKALFLSVGFERSVDLAAAQAGDDGAFQPIDGPVHDRRHRRLGRSSRATRCSVRTAPSPTPSRRRRDSVSTQTLERPSVSSPAFGGDGTSCLGGHPGGAGPVEPARNRHPLPGAHGRPADRSR